MGPTEDCRRHKKTTGDSCGNDSGSYHGERSSDDSNIYSLQHYYKSTTVSEENSTYIGDNIYVYEYMDYNPLLSNNGNGDNEKDCTSNGSKLQKLQTQTPHSSREKQ